MRKGSKEAMDGTTKRGNRAARKMTVLVFGSEDIGVDSLPLKILPELQRRLPEINFLVKDPNEDFELPEETVIIDTVVSLEEPRVFSSLDDFQAPPRTTLHDFDWFSHLQLLKKLGKLPSKIKIVGLPPTISEEEAIDFLMFSKELLFSSS